jgi:hypothetical protein
MSFARFRLAVYAAGLGLAATACGDSLGLPPPIFENVVDTATLFALQGTDISAPSGYDVALASTSRTELGQPFDLAFDLDEADRPRIYPSGALGIASAAAVQTSDDTFDAIARAPLEGYQADTAIVVAPGTVFLARSRALSTFCSFLGALPRYGKFHVLEVDGPARSVTIELLVNQNCGYRSLTPGPVES